MTDSQSPKVKVYKSTGSSGSRKLPRWLIWLFLGLVLFVCSRLLLQIGSAQRANRVDEIEAANNAASKYQSIADGSQRCEQAGAIAGLWEKLDRQEFQKWSETRDEDCRLAELGKTSYTPPAPRPQPQPAEPAAAEPERAPVEAAPRATGELERFTEAIREADPSGTLVSNIQRYDDTELLYLTVTYTFLAFGELQQGDLAISLRDRWNSECDCNGMIVFQTQQGQEVMKIFSSGQPKFKKR